MAEQYDDWKGTSLSGFTSISGTWALDTANDELKDSNQSDYTTDWIVGDTDLGSADQQAIVQLVDWDKQTLGVALRHGSPGSGASAHYQIRHDGSELRVDRHAADGSFAEQVLAVGTVSLAKGDHYAFGVSGTGASTTFYYKDMGSTEPAGFGDIGTWDIEAAYGTGVTVDPADAVDSGSYAGLRSYTLNGQATPATFGPYRAGSMGGGATTVSLTEAGSGGDAWTAIATSPAAVSEAGRAGITASALASSSQTVTESAQAGDTVAAIASVAMSLTEAVTSQDSDAAPATALAAITASASGDDLVAAVAQASAAIPAGAAAGEAWVAQAQAVVDLIEAGAAADVVTQGATSAQQAATDAGTAAGDAFATSVAAVANCTHAANAGDAFIATVVAMTTITETGQAGDSLTTGSTEGRSLSDGSAASDSNSAVAQVVAAITAAVTGQGIYTAGASVAAAIAEAAQAGDSWSAVVPGTGYLVASAITITAALSGSPSLAAALSGATSTTPALSGTPKIKPDS